MAQLLKEEVARAIRHSALDVFAKRGYRDASVAEIARGAGVSTGNVYKYFESKDVLFYEVVPPSFVKGLRTRLFARVEGARGVRGTALDGHGPHVEAAEALTRFTLDHRRETVIALGRASGSRYERLREELVRDLTKSALAHAAALTPSLEVTPAMRFVLARIYEGFVAAQVEILTEHEQEHEIRAAVLALGRYHLAGLERLLTPAT